MLQVNGENQHPNKELPTAYFMVKNGLLYYHCSCCGNLCELLVIPRSKIDSIMHLAHYYLLGGHVGLLNTLEKIQCQFHLLGMVAKVCNFCQCCPQCQHTYPYKLALALLSPLFIMRVPFEWVGMDLLGLLPRSVWGHEYILVIVDYVT